ncbi:MAG: D-alanyl-D-alanine dipeptidase [Candidatus Poriferisodalaceae bacterium]
MSKHWLSKHWLGPNEQGQVALFATLLLLAAVLMVAAVAWVVLAGARSAQAQAAADAAALAGASSGVGAATVLATANGAHVESVVVHGDEIEVRVEFGGQFAVARARRIATAATRRRGLAPAMVAALSRAEQLLGVELVIVSGYRSSADQQRLWDARETNPYPVARPGTSVHERGLAVDVAIGQVASLVSVATDAGLCHPLPQIDPVHFEVCQIPG